MIWPNLMKGLFFLLFLGVSNITNGQYAKIGEFDIVLWDENYNLRWSDFQSEKGKAGNCSNGAESCVLILGYPQTIDNKISMNVINVFIKNKSWKTGEVRNKLLEHEQIHFDISEYYTRLIRHYLSHISFSTRIEAQAFVDVCMEMYNNEQKSFDLETVHGHDLKAQNKWKEKITYKINSLDKYYKSVYTTNEFGKFEKQLNATYKN